MRKLLMAIMMSVGAMVSLPLEAASPAQSVVVEECVVDTQPSIKVDGCVLELRSGEAATTKFEIFSITGQLIKSVTAKAAPLRVELPKGFYIVKCESWTRRVMLK